MMIKLAMIATVAAMVVPAAQAQSSRPYTLQAYTCQPLKSVAEDRFVTILQRDSKTTVQLWDREIGLDSTNVIGRYENSNIVVQIKNIFEPAAGATFTLKVSNETVPCKAVL